MARRKRPETKWVNLGVDCPTCGEEIRVGTRQINGRLHAVEGWAWNCEHQPTRAMIVDLVEKKLEEALR